MLHVSCCTFVLLLTFSSPHTSCTSKYHGPTPELKIARKSNTLIWELRNIYHHNPESKIRKSSDANSGSINPFGRYGNAVKTSKTISTIAFLWPVKAIFEKRAATVEVDTLNSPADLPFLLFSCSFLIPFHQRVFFGLAPKDLK